MSCIPARVESRIKDALKRFVPVIEQARARDVGEADTSTLVKDILSELFGYDKYSEITAEYQIKNTYCDLALKINNEVALLVEVKAINLDLKEAFIKQAVDYAVNKGLEWVVLTNAHTWQVYRLIYGQPVVNELLMTFSLPSINAKADEDLERLYMLSREAHGKSLLDAYHLQRQALSRFCVGAVVLSEPVLSVIRRELKRMSPDARIDVEEIDKVLRSEVIKREVLEGEKADEARRKISRATGKALRARRDVSEKSQVEGATVSDTQAQQGAISTHAAPGVAP